jgi:hypothetical protein
MFKLNNFTLLLFSIFLFLQCEKKEDSSYPFVEYDSKGELTAILNGKSWEAFKPSSRFSTLVTFSNRSQNKNNCENDSLYTINIFSLIDKKFSDFNFAIILDSKSTKIHKKFVSYTVPSKIESKHFCESGRSFLSITEVDAPMADYAVDTNYTNYFKIDRVTDEKIEGSFDIKFIESRVYRGLVNPWSDVPDTLHFVCNKFTALKDTLF